MSKDSRFTLFLKGVIGEFLPYTKMNEETFKATLTDSQIATILAALNVWKMDNNKAIEKNPGDVEFLEIRKRINSAIGSIAEAQ